MKKYRITIIEDDYPLFLNHKGTTIVGGFLAKSVIMNAIIRTFGLHFTEFDGISAGGTFRIKKGDKWENFKLSTSAFNRSFTISDELYIIHQDTP